MPDFVSLQVEDGVGTIRLDRPKMNAIDEQLHQEVRAAAMEASERDEVRAVIIYGGERVFAAGADIKAMSQIDGSAMTGFGMRATSVNEWVSSRPHATMLAPSSWDIALMSAPAANTRSPP